MTISRDGLALPVSRKLMWRCETPASAAKPSWETWRLVRQSLSFSPNVTAMGSIYRRLVVVSIT